MGSIGGYGQGFLRVAGPKGSGTLYFVENKTNSGWDIEAEELVPKTGHPTLDLTPPVQPENTGIPFYGHVDLVPMGPRVSSLLAPLPAYYEAKLGVPVKLLPPDIPPSNLEDRGSHKFNGYRLVNFLEKSHPAIASDPSAVMIGVTPADMEAVIYGQHREHVTNLRVGVEAAVVSLPPIEPRSDASRANPLVLPVRLRKAITRDIGLLIYPLTMSNDPTSVLYATRGTPSDLDMMGENFRNAVGEWVPGWGDMEPTVDITRLPDGKIFWRLGTPEDAPTDVRAESWQSDLTIGLFMQEQTDFPFTGPWGRPFIRAYRPRDNWSRAFGIGASDSFDLFLVGVFGRWIDLVTADGERIHFQRNWWNPLSQEYLLSTQDGLSHQEVLRYNGGVWHFRSTDGWNFTFPDSYRAYRPQQGAMIGMTDPQGRAYKMKRDAQGNLLYIVSPAGNRIDFRYDSQGRIIEARDNHGRSVQYGYDSRGRLVHVQDSAGRVENYVYDDRNDMTEIEDGSGRPLLTNKYDSAGWIIRQKLADGSTFRYRYERDADGNLEKTFFIGPQGYEIVYSFSQGSYWQTWPALVKAAPH